MKTAAIPVLLLSAGLAAADCTATLPEDDYHRIKGLLQGSHSISHRYAEGKQVLLRVVFAPADSFTEQLNRRRLARYGSLNCIRKENTDDKPRQTPPAAIPAEPQQPRLKLGGRPAQ